MSVLNMLSEPFYPAALLAERVMDPAIASTFDRVHVMDPAIVFAVTRIRVMDPAITDAIARNSFKVVA